MESGRKGRLRNRESLELSIMCFPAAALTFLFCYVPMAGIVVAFKDFRYDLGVFGSRWTGLDNFAFFFASNDAFRITRNTLVMNGLFIVAGTALAITFALLMYELTKKWQVKLYQTLHLLPHFISWVIVGYITYALFNPNFGIVNQALAGLGLPKVEWYAVPSAWPAILVAFNAWKGVGMGLIIYYAALMGIDSALFEAAMLDGASRLQQIRYISVPSLHSLIVIQVILAIGNIFRADFGMFYQLTRDVGALYPTTDVVDTYVYRALKSMGNMSMSAAAGLFQSIVGFILVLTTNWIVKRINPENSLF